MSGSWRGPVGASALSLALALALSACQDGYPLAATRCDRWCKLSQAVECGAFTPGGCVASCEENRIDPACDQIVDALLACMAAHESTIGCELWNYGTIAPCQAEHDQQRACSLLYLPSGARSKSGASSK